MIFKRCGKLPVITNARYCEDCWTPLAGRCSWRGMNAFQIHPHRKRLPWAFKRDGRKLAKLRRD